MLAFLVALIFAVAGTPPAPTRWVTDNAGFVSEATRANLDDKLENYERATGHQVVVWIGKSLDGASIDRWANETFAAWRLGRAHADDGVALFVFADDRELAIEVGYGLEGQLTDARSSQILLDVMAPKLREGKRDEALTAGVEAILASLEGKPWIAPESVQPAAQEPGHLTWIVGAVLLIALVLFAFKRPGAALLFLSSFMPDRGGFRGGGGGGGFFRGGGGRSGGGGARGGW